MHVPPQRMQSPKPSGDEGADLFDYGWIRGFLGFVARSVARHRWLAVGTLVATVVVAGIGLWALPRTYLVETRILAQRNPVMSVLANPNFGRPSEADAPTRAAKETVLRWENLIALVKETGLADVPPESRAPAARARDWLVTNVLGREATREEKIEGLAYALEKKLKVNVTDGVVVIAVEWSDPTYAFRIAERALQNFMEARHATEISIVGEAIAILQSHLAGLDEQIRDLEDRLARSKPAGAPRARRARPAIEPAVEGQATAAELAKLRAVLASKQRALSDLEDFRVKRLAELQTQLAQQRSVYSDRHPAVVSTLQSIEGLSGPSPQIENLQLEIRDLRASLDAADGAAPAGPASTVAAPGLAAPVDTANARDTEIRGELRVLYSKRSTLLDRIDSARMEMDTAQAAFKYRYVVIGPPQMPKRPVRPVPALVWIGSVLGGLVLAVVVSALFDLRSGRVVERWQVENQLALPVLGELSRR